MKVTIITLYDGHEAEHFCALVVGEVSHEEFEELAKTFNAVIPTDVDDTPDDARQLFKVEVNTHASVADVKDMQALY